MVVPIAVGAGGAPNLLEIAGTRCGTVLSVEGGWGVADVIEEPSRQPAKKHVGPVRWEPLQLGLDLQVARPIHDWIVASWKGNVQARDLAITTVDPQGNAVRRREFRNALLTTTTIPALDASQEPDLLTLTVLPQAAQTTPVSGTVSSVALPPVRRLTPRLQLPGLDCTQVTRIEGSAVRQAYGNPTPTGLSTWLEPGPLTFPNLTVTLLETSAKDWHLWFEDFVVKGHNDDTNEKAGVLTLLDEQRNQAVARIGLFNVGIFQLKGPIERPELPPYVVAGLYCERMEFTLP